MIKRPKLASRRVLLHHQFGDLISEFLLLYRHILQHILMISKTSMMKRKTLAELKKIYYHIIHNITIVTQIIQNWPKEKKFTLKYTPIGTPTRYPNKFGKLLKILLKVKKFVTVCLYMAVSTNFWFFLKVACLVTLFDRKLQVSKNSPKLTILGIFNFVHSKGKKSRSHFNLTNFWTEKIGMIFT